MQKLSNPFSPTCATFFAIFLKLFTTQTNVFYNTKYLFQHKVTQMLRDVSHEERGEQTN